MELPRIVSGLARAAGALPWAAWTALACMLIVAGLVAVLPDDPESDRQIEELLRFALIATFLLPSAAGLFEACRNSPRGLSSLRRLAVGFGIGAFVGAVVGLADSFFERPQFVLSALLSSMGGILGVNVSAITARRVDSRDTTAVTPSLDPCAERERANLND